MNWYERLLRQKVLWEERLLIRQRKVLLHWIEAQGVIPNESVIVALADDVSVFFYDAGEWRKRSRLSLDTTCRFVLCEATIFSSVLKQQQLEGEWRKIFHTKEFEVWESKSYYQKHALSLPLRLGLDETVRSGMGSMLRLMSFWD